MHARWFVILVAGCLPAAIPRGGRVGDAGDLRFAVAYTGTLGAGTVDTGGHAHHGNSALFAIGQGDVGPPLVSIDIQLSLGVDGGCEVGALLGVMKLGPEVRCRLVRADPTPIAAAAGAYWKLYTGAEISVGLESGVRFPVDLYVSYGEQRHAMVLADGGGGRDPAVLVVHRRELRLTGAVAATARADTDSLLLVGLSPYLTLDASAPDEVRCEHCRDDAVARTFDETFGIGFALGAASP